MGKGLWEGSGTYPAKINISNAREEDVLQGSKKKNKQTNNQNVKLKV